MEQTLYGYEQCPVENAVEEIVNASRETGIRMFNVERTRSYEPQEWGDGNWMLPDVDSAPAFSATAWLTWYNFGAKTLVKMTFRSSL